MRFWQFLRFTPAHELPELAQVAENAGFHGVMLGDHIFFPEQVTSPYPYSKDNKAPWDANTPWPDPWCSIAAMATVTKRIHFSTNICVLPLRNPFEVARAAATLSQLSNNRFALGAGIGWMEEEYSISGIDFQTRGKRYDELLDIVRLLWQGRMVEYHGEIFDFPRLEISPSPIGHVPIYLAGGSAAAMRRAAHKADGWITGHFTARSLPGMMANIKAMLAEAGRQDEPFEIIANCTASLDMFKLLRDHGITSIITLPSPDEIGVNNSLEQKSDYIKNFATSYFGNI